MGTSFNHRLAARAFAFAALALSLAGPSVASAGHSTLTVRARDQGAGESVVVPSGARVVVTVESAPGDWVERGLRVQAVAPPVADYHSNIVRTISPERPAGASSVSIGGPLYYPAGQTTRFEWTTRQLLPGRYRLVALLYDADGNLQHTSEGRPDFVVSNSFTVSSEESDDILPPESTQSSVDDLRRAIQRSMTKTAPTVMRLFDMNGAPLTGRTAATGQMVALAINTSGMATLDNRVRFSLSPADGSPAFPWLEVYPAASFARSGAPASVGDIQQSVGPVLIQLFHLPAPMYSFDQSGQAELMIRYQRYEGGSLPRPADDVPAADASLVSGRFTTSVSIGDSPAQQVAMNPGPAIDTFRVKIVTPDLGIGNQRLDDLAREVEAYFHYATRHWFELDVEVVPVPLADLAIDYRRWWAGRAADPARPLDPGIDADMRLIEHIYASESSHQSRIYGALQEAFPPRSGGEDITLYVRWARSSGGAVQSPSRILTHFQQPLFALDYEQDGLWGRPTPTEPAAALDTEDKRRLIVNIINHEIAHAAWQRPLGIGLWHCNSSFLRQGSPDDSGRDHRVLQFAPGNYALRRLGWGHTLMSYARNRHLTTNGGGRIADDQLQLVLQRYARVTEVRTFKTYVKLYWQAPVDPHHFELQWSDTASFSEIAGEHTSIGGSRRWANIMASQLGGIATARYARVRSCDALGDCGPWSAPQRFTPASSTIVGLKSMSHYLKAMWTSPFGDEDHFAIQWSETPDFTRISGSVNHQGVALKNGTRWLNLMGWHGLQSGRTYYVRVRSCWGRCGFWSEPRKVTY